MSPPTTDFDPVEGGPSLAIIGNGEDVNANIPLPKRYDVLFYRVSFYTGVK
jgi:hypothetical protein